MGGLKKESLIQLNENVIQDCRGVNGIFSCKQIWFFLQVQPKFLLAKTCQVVWLGAFFYVMLCVTRHNMIKFKTLDRKHIGGVKLVFLWEL